VKLRLAALRMLFDWMVVGQILPVNPATPCVAEAYSEKRQNSGPDCRRGAHPNRRDRHHFPSGLRDRALIGLMVYTFAGWERRSQ